ncbi:recombinase family protein [Pseudomonas sp. MDT1-17]
MKNLIRLVDQLDVIGAGLRCLQEGNSTASTGGRVVFQLFGILAVFERNLIRVRAQSGRSSARAGGGRKG